MNNFKWYEFVLGALAAVAVLALAAAFCVIFFL